MNRFFLIALYALAAVTLFQFFLTNKTPQTSQNADITISILDDTLVIPNVPKLDIVNHTNTGFTLNTCEDISITVDSRPLTGIKEGAPKFCQTIAIPQNTKTPVSFGYLSPILSKLPGKYLITIRTPFGDRTNLFSLDTPGTFRIVLTNIVYNPIYNFFVGLIQILPGHSLGWAILIITIIIRLILLVPQQHMLESQKKLQVIQPKIKALQEKYKDDQAKLGMEMLELYKKENVSPMGSCLPLLIQMPILIGLYWVVSSITDPSNFYHLYAFFQNFNPESINTHFLGLDLKQIGGTVGIVFAIILAIFQYIQAKLSFGYNPPPQKTNEKGGEEKTEGLEAALDPALMQKSMLYVLPITIGISALFFPLGVGLYWFIGTLFVIAQQWYVNKKKIN